MRLLHVFEGGICRGIVRFLLKSLQNLLDKNTLPYPVWALNQDKMLHSLFTLENAVDRCEYFLHNLISAEELHVFEFEPFCKSKSECMGFKIGE